MSTKIEGIVDRCGGSLAGHGDHGFKLLLKDSSTIYHLPGAREAYAPIHGRNSDANDFLISLTGAGDHVTFELDGIKVKPRTFRNWTLEVRLLGHPEKDITPGADVKTIT